MLKFKKTNNVGGQKDNRNHSRTSIEPQIPEGLWIKCPKCGEALYKEDVVAKSYVCYKCHAYFRVRTKNRLRMVLDRSSFEEWDVDLHSNDPLNFKGYAEKLSQVQEKTKLSEAVTTGKGTINGVETAIGVSDARFLMGSMGQAVGEKIARMFERATEEKLPVIMFCCSGGARMQEGMVSLMQMAKTSAAVKKHSEAGLLYISVLTDPTTGGVTASYAMLGDIILAEPGALIGFAGPRVIEQTIGQKLPEGFQKAEFCLEHGLIDGIVERENLKQVLYQLICMHKGIDCNLSATVELGGKGISPLSKKYFTPWERVKLSRKMERANAQDYIDGLFDGFMEMHGDRHFADDNAIVGGIAYFHGTPVTVIGVQKGKNTKDYIAHNFGMPSPEGYRKALRLMKQAEKFKRPVICFVDTPGAFCGLEAEERGQGEAIARNIMEMSALEVPVLSIMIGEGGSGGALALAVANEVWMLENATYSILSPEGFASILWKDSKRAEEAAGVMKITAADLKQLGIVERIIEEPEPAGDGDMGHILKEISVAMDEFLTEYELLSSEEIRERRYNRFRKM